MVDLSIVPREISFFFLSLRKKIIVIVENSYVEELFCFVFFFVFPLFIVDELDSVDKAFIDAGMVRVGVLVTAHTNFLYSKISLAILVLFPLLSFSFLFVCVFSINNNRRLLVVLLRVFFFLKYENDNDAISDFHLVGGVVCDAANKRTQREHQANV